jgi:monoamine oxidase
MARTPLLSFFESMSKDHVEADARGVSPERVLEERLERERQGISRRAFLRAAAGVAAGVVAFPRFARAGTPPRIAIVGGGIAGLNAALTLQDAGYASTVYDSWNKVGGRMYSNSSYWQNGQVTEWCGELIDTGHKTIIQLCNRFNLQLDDLKTNSSGQDTFFFFGQYYPVKQAYSDWQNGIWQAIQKDQHSAPFPTQYNSSTAAGQALDQMSIYDWIESRIPGGHRSPMGAMLDIAYNIEFGAETTDQASLNLIYMLGFNKQTGGTATAGPNGSFQMFGSSDERYHIRGGNMQLPVAVSKALNNPVLLGYKLTSIAKQSDGTYSLVFATSSGTKTVTADLVVLALPFATLRNVDYGQAGFDSLKDTAIQQLGRGANGKLQLQFNSRYWTGTGPWLGNSSGLTYSDTGYQNTWEVTRAQPGDTGILVDYTGGNVTVAMNTQTSFALISDAKYGKQVTADAQRFLGQLEQALPGGKASWNGMATSSLPKLEPNLGLAYSYYRKGQYTTFSGYEKVRQGNVFFAGEHCSTNFQGFMEGGAEEGARAASEILTQVGK